jgi:hypothetical protein
MAEIDIDKMLEQNEKKDKAKKAKSWMMTLVIAGCGAAVLAIAGIIITMLIIGEPGSSFFPTTPGIKYVYNKKGKNPEERSFLDKKENLYGYVCSVLNITDKGSYTTRQEYYCVDKEKGYARLAYSFNHGPKEKDIFVIMPYNIKDGKQWNAGMVKDKVVKAVIVGREKMTTPAGELEAIRVEYKAAPYMDEVIWYAKDLGVVKEQNNLTADETSLISSGE